MSHFAEIGGLSAFTLTTEISAGTGTEVVVLSGFRATVQQVIVAEPDFIGSGAVGSPSNWVQCSYNGRIRNVYPGMGYIYESIRDIFHLPQPYPSWSLEKKPIKDIDENFNIVIKKYEYNWEPPVPMPTDGFEYIWNESTISWEKSIYI